MTYATPAQRAFIRSLSGVSVESAAQDYGFAPGHALTIRDASLIIDSLKGVENVAPVNAVSAPAPAPATSLIGRTVVISAKNGVVVGEEAGKRGKINLIVRMADGSTRKTPAAFAEVF